MAARSSMFGTERIALFKGKCWADMSDSDSDSEEAAPVLNQKAAVEASTAPVKHVEPVVSAVAETKVAPVTKVAEQPKREHSATVPAISAAAPVTAAVVAAAPKASPWGKGNPLAASGSVAAIAATATPAAVHTPVVAAPAPRPSAAVASAKKQQQLPTISSWGELTASFGSKTLATASVAAQPKPAPQKPAGLAHDEEDAAVSSSVSFDPELDSSRDGLPLLFKGLSKAPAAADSAPVMMTVVEEEECSKSRQGTKRKAEDNEAEEEPAAAPSVAAAPVDMTSLVASFKPAAAPAKVAWGGAGLKKPAAAAVPVAAAAAAIPAAATPADVQQPATGKKLRRNDGSAKHVEASAAAPSLARPQSFVAAVTGKEPAVAVPSAAAAPVAATVAAAAAAVASPARSAPKVVDAATLQRQWAMRQKQIDLGKRTEGYLNYVALVPVSQRLPTHPRTPDPKKVASKRSMDGTLRQWRRALHEWDPATIAAKANGTYVAPAAASSSSAANMSDDGSASDGEMVEQSESSAAPSEDGFVLVKDQ